METIKSLTKEAQEAGYTYYWDLLLYWHSCGNTDFYKEFKKYSSKLLFAILDLCHLSETGDEVAKWKLHCAATSVLKSRLHIKG